jgi:transposase InsO family protein
MKVVPERLGHSGLAITADLYSHVRQQIDQDAADRTAPTSSEVNELNHVSGNRVAVRVESSCRLQLSHDRGSIRVEILQHPHHVLVCGVELNRRSWETREELRIAIVTWIERTYHRRRRQDALGRLTPVEFEVIMTTPADQAA